MILHNHNSELSDGIRNLVEKGLDPRIQKAMDVVRVTGNNAVHPGQTAFDDSSNVQSLFKWINLIADALITHPKKVAEEFDSLPEKRDQQTT